MTWGTFLVDHTWHLAGLVLLLAGSAFFSGSETALFSLSRAQLYRLRQSGKSGPIIASVMRRPRLTLNTLLLGNMLVNVAFAAISATIVYNIRAGGAGPWTIGVASLAPLLALILFGEVAPKIVAYAYRLRWSALAAGLIKATGAILSPLLWAADRLLILPLTQIIAPAGHDKTDISADELGALLDLTAKRGVLDHDANELLQEILELTDLRVSDIMVPRVDMIAYDASGHREGLKKLFAHTRLRRIPLYENDLDHIIGVVHYRRLLLDDSTPLTDLAVAAPFVPEAGNLERLLAQFLATKTQTAIVVDEYGGTAGLVTLQDVLEEIVGDIPEPSDALIGARVVQNVADNVYVVDGDLPIHEWSEVIKTEVASRRISTIGGFVTSLLGRIPKPGDTVEYRNLRFTVQTMRQRRVGKCRIELVEGRS